MNELSEKISVTGVAQSVEIHTSKKARVLVVGEKEKVDLVKQKLKEDCQFLGRIIPRIPVKEEEGVYGGIQTLKEVITSQKVDEIYWTLPSQYHSLEKYFVNLCKANMVRLYDVKVLGHHIEKVESAILSHEPLRKPINKFLKRSFDIIISLLVIIFVLSWMIPLFALIIKLTSRGPVFFIQERSGLKNEVFKMIKFRSMHLNDQADVKACEEDDPRVTPFGWFLRKTSLDEIPQFLHSFTGSMSVVGPRPHMVNHTSEYAGIVSSFMVRHLVKPGITGWAQVNNCNGSIERSNDILNRVNLDTWYMENWSLWLDIKICFKTLGMFRRK